MQENESVQDRAERIPCSSSKGTRLTAGHGGISISRTPFGQNPLKVPVFAGWRFRCDGSHTSYSSSAIDCEGVQGTNFAPRTSLYTVLMDREPWVIPPKIGCPDEVAIRLPLVLPSARQPCSHWPGRCRFRGNVRYHASARR